MSGIGGICRLRGGHVASEEIFALISAITHRGVDRVGCWVDGPVGFGSTLLFTTEESLKEILPYTDRQSGMTITADARIDNRDDVLSELGIRQFHHKSVPDSTIILEAYKRWGDKAPEKLAGDFAFAIWNPAKHELFCARDHMGIKPFYYFLSKDVLIFGSEIKAIFASREARNRVNEQRVLEYLVFYHSDAESTFFTDIKRLPARSTLTVTPEKVRVSRYWDFSPGKEIRLQSDTEYAEAFKEKFEQAVTCRLRSAYPIGSFLSGGLDSSSIACVAAGHLRSKESPRLITFSEIFTELPADVRHLPDERRYMDAAIRHCGAEAYFVEFRNHGPLRELERDQYDEPMPYLNGYLFDRTCAMAQERGVRVLLDGTDGDTTVSHGYERLYHLGTSYRLLALLRQAQKLCSVNERHFSPRRVLWKYAIHPSFSNAFVRSVKKMLGRDGDTAPYKMVDVLSSEFTHYLNWQARGEEIGLSYSRRRQGRYLQYLEFVSPFQQYTMEFIDTLGAKYPLEIRYPFWDRRLMEFCLALPLEQKLNNGWTRCVLRRAMKGILPDTIVQRPGKADLSPQFLLDFHRTAEPWVNRLLGEGAEVKRYVDSAKIKQWWDVFRQNPYRNVNIAIDLYVLISLEIWLKRMA